MSLERIHTRVSDSMDRLSSLDNDWNFKRLRANLFAAYHSGYREALISLRYHDDHLDLFIYDVGPIQFADGTVEHNLHMPYLDEEEQEVEWFNAVLIPTLNRLHGIT